MSVLNNLNGNIIMRTETLLCCMFLQVFYDLMREIRARKMEASRQSNGKQNKERRKIRCTVL